MTRNHSCGCLLRWHEGEEGVINACGINDLEIILIVSADTFSTGGQITEEDNFLYVLQGQVIPV